MMPMNTGSSSRSRRRPRVRDVQREPSVRRAPLDDEFTRGAVLPPLNAADELRRIGADNFAQLDELTDFEPPFSCLEF